MKRSVAVALGTLLTVVCLVAGYLLGSTTGPQLPQVASPGPAAAPTAPKAPAAAPEPVPGGDPPPLATCPELAKQDPEMASLTLAALEERYAKKLGLPPELARKVADKMQAPLYSLPAERRACIYRVMLLTALAPKPAEAANPAN